MKALLKFEVKGGAVTYHDNGMVMVENEDGLTDYPVHYKHGGTIAYDFPERFSVEVKAMAKEVFDAMVTVRKETCNIR